MSIARREFLVGGVLPMLAGTVSTHAAERADAVKDPIVNFYSDGLALSPADYARLLGRLAELPGIEVDNYSRDGVVGLLEQQIAKLLGKEMAVYLPTGTLANHLAVRVLAGGRHRVLVQQESHLYNDAGDCAQQLSGSALVPLAAGRATFTLEQVESEVRRLETGRVRTAVGAISIESPVRRASGEVFNFDEMRKISEFARGRGIGFHLDGARVFLASPYTGVHPRNTQLFSTPFMCHSINTSTRPPVRSSLDRAGCWKTSIMTAACSAAAWRRSGPKPRSRCIIWKGSPIALRVRLRSLKRSSKRSPRIHGAAWIGLRMGPT
jgi:threonine aldolase